MTILPPLDLRMQNPRRLCLALLLLTAACTAVGPDYRPPAMPLTAGYAEGGGTGPAGDVAQDRWWTDFGDARLDALVARGLAQNVDIQTAVERLNAADAQVRAAGGAALVSGTVSADYARARSQTGAISTDGSGTAAAVLVLDIFGGQRRALESARAGFDAAAFDIGTARLAFLSSLVGNYIDARYAQEGLAISRNLAASRQETLNLVTQQRELGTATELQVVQAQALLDQTRATIPALEKTFHTAVYAIATLLAQPAAPILAEMQRGGAQPRPRRGSDAGVPADLLRNRPDVRAAERAYAGAIADVGVAEADMLPAVTLSGTITAASRDTWSFGPALSLPVLNQPVLRAGRDAAASRARQAELAWRGSVLSAVEDVQRAQSAYLRDRREVAALAATARSYARARDLSRETYEVGTTSFLDFLDAERSMGDAQRAVAVAVQTLANDWVALQIAAGRGWAAR